MNTRVFLLTLSFVFFFIIIQTFSIPFPLLPHQFRLKAKIWFGSSDPYILLLHYDATISSTREDYYYYNTTNYRHERFMTSIKLFNTKQDYIILYNTINVFTPTTCIVVPIVKFGTFPTLNSFNFQYIGPATLSSIIDNNNSNRTCLHFTSIFYDNNIDVCIASTSSDDTNSFFPLFLSISDQIFVEILEFEHAIEPKNTFDPSKVALVQCAPFGSTK